ncbi:hypothetical protein [Mesorhizobium sp. WSM2239]|uniref:Methylase n=2 Tax=unclassified Mesorhizobium TaxID=325217 RepID=A0AAU8DIH7_9HYPH
MNVLSTASAAGATALSAPAPEHADHIEAVLRPAGRLVPSRESGCPIGTNALRTIMVEYFGGTNAEGFWIWKDAYEALEAAQVLFLKKFGPAIISRSQSPQAVLAMMRKIAQLIPTHTRRSDESRAMQQLSTPLPLAFITARAAAIVSADLVLEPSAETGLLAVHAEIAQASLALNEFSGMRADLLRLLFPRVPTFRHAAANIDDHLDAIIKPSVILMNPPFTVPCSCSGVKHCHHLGFSGERTVPVMSARRPPGRSRAKAEERCRHAASETWPPDGTVEHRLRLVRPADELRFGLDASAETHWQPTTREIFAQMWEAEVAAVPEFTTSTFHVVTGLLLPIWRRLPDDDCRVYRIQTDSGERIIGRHIAPALVATLFRNLGLDHAPSVSMDEAWTGLIEGLIGMQLADGLSLRRSRVMNDYRVELIGFTNAMVPRLKALELISEIISWELRLFVPTSIEGPAILARLLKRHALIAVTDRAAT